MGEVKFEEALERLESIVKKMEQGEMTLEESLDAFEEGIKLSRFCSKKLDDIERRVEVLLKENSAVTIKQFTGDDENES
ncbi:MAG TPA: exodeoxyribonuclease VII small subunit [Deltaproteobacteria bacterium]|nr:exodeoxyribonuclease VII small subunit [Deltaproteobacteria bacterium]